MTGKVAGAARGSPLRQRMIEQMRIANLAESTQSAYLFEVERLILATPDLRHRAAFIAAYGAGLRVSETATVAVDEFIRRFLLHVLLERLHRIRHFGILANGCRATQFALDRSHHPAAEGRMGSRKQDANGHRATRGNAGFEQISIANRSLVTPPPPHFPQRRQSISGAAPSFKEIE